MLVTSYNSSHSHHFGSTVGVGVVGFAKHSVVIFQEMLHGINLVDGTVYDILWDISDLNCPDLKGDLKDVALDTSGEDSE
jgi:hypothetical protein